MQYTNEWVKPSASLPSGLDGWMDERCWAPAWIATRFMNGLLPVNSSLTSSHTLYPIKWLTDSTRTWFVSQSSFPKRLFVCVRGSGVIYIDVNFIFHPSATIPQTFPSIALFRSSPHHLPSHHRLTNTNRIDLISFGLRTFLMLVNMWL